MPGKQATETGLVMDHSEGWMQRIKDWWSARKRKNFLKSLGLGQLDDLNALFDEKGSDFSDKKRAENLNKALTKTSERLKQCLVEDLAEPSWGPKGSRRAHQKSRKRGLKELNELDRRPSIFRILREKFRSKMLSWIGYEPEERPAPVIEETLKPAKTETNHEKKIYQNLNASEEYYRFSWLYIGAVVIGVVIVGGAMFVDFQIMNEFWTRVLSNEFMEVPPSLATSVVSKSSQVIFATAAFHFFLSRWPHKARTGFVVVLFFLTMGMIFSFGVLNADISMPAKAESVTAQQTQDEPSLSDALMAMGLMETGIEAQPAVLASVVPEMRPPHFVEVGYFIEDSKPVLWVLAPGLVFLVVTGIAALFLQVAENNIKNFIMSMDFKKRSARVGQWEVLQSYFSTPKTQTISNTQEDIIDEVSDWPKVVAEK